MTSYLLIVKHSIVEGGGGFKPPKAVKCPHTLRAAYIATGARVCHARTS